LLRTKKICITGRPYERNIWNIYSRNKNINKKFESSIPPKFTFNNRYLKHVDDLQNASYFTTNVCLWERIQTDRWKKITKILGTIRFSCNYCQKENLIYHFSWTVWTALPYENGLSGRSFKFQCHVCTSNNVWYGLAKTTQNWLIGSYKSPSLQWFINTRLSGQSLWCDA